jgi:hypothetical protein
MAESTVRCAWCGTEADALPLTWSLSRAGGRDDHLCDRCSRDQLRAIEGKLDLVEGGW